MQRLYETYGARAQFFIVYIREAHPSDGWQVPANTRQGVVYEQPRDLAARANLAGSCMKGLTLSIPCLLDDMASSAQKAYAAWPSRAYVVDLDGRIAHKGAPGPGGFDLRRVEQTLTSLLANGGRMYPSPSPTPAAP